MMPKIKYHDLVGIPFKTDGRDKNGIDCYGIAIEMYKRLGKPLPEYIAETDQRSLIHRMVMDGEHLFTKIEKPEPFCIVTFCIREPYITHIAVVLENCVDFIHVLNNKLSVCIESLENPSWSCRIRGFYKWMN